MNELDYEEGVLAGMLLGHSNRLERALTRLEPRHFSGDRARLFAAAGLYRDGYGGTLPVDLVANILTKEGVDLATALRCQDLAGRLLEIEVPDDRFLCYIDALVDRYADSATGEVFVDAAEIREHGITRGGVSLSGHAAARLFALEQLTDIDRASDPRSMPEGPMHDAAASILERYAAAKSTPGAGRIPTGLPTLDEATGGLGRGELVLVAGATGEGKSHLAIQIAWHAAVEQGKNVVFINVESTRDQLLARIVARHSKFLCPDGPLNSRGIRDGALSADQEDFLDRVVDDLGRGFEEHRHGLLHVAQVPHGSTLGALHGKLRVLEKAARLDLVVIDYLALLSPRQARGSRYEEMADTVDAAKQMAMTLGEGAGVPVVTPWQVNRTGRKDAQRSGFYDLADLADTAQAERTADQIVAILKEPDRPELRLDILKNREGPVTMGLSLDVDFSCGWISEHHAPDAMALLMED